ncbi:MAG TPA: FAD-binding dehydrogenase, partial [Coriobacteriia bacterium]|nr:FAD-binding dehydrogenase [Coriobacteriia bacterium]
AASGGRAAGGSSSGGGASAGAGHSWDTAPDPITTFAETIETDILIIGAGISGLATACSAAESNAKVLVVEKCAEFNGRERGFGAIN